MLTFNGIFSSPSIHSTRKNYGLFKSINSSASGLTAETLRMDVISNNIANVNTTRTKEGGPYRRKNVVFEPRGYDAYHLDLPPFVSNNPADTTGEGVRVVDIVEDKEEPMRLVYNPNHPDAHKRSDYFNKDGSRKDKYKDMDDKKFSELTSKIGYVEFPNVNVTTEMVDMITASRAYEANVATIKAAKTMMEKAIELGR